MVDTVRYINTDSTPGGDGTTNNTTGTDRAYATLGEWVANAGGAIGVGNRHIGRFSTPSSVVDQTKLVFDTATWGNDGELILEALSYSVPAIMQPSGSSGHGIECARDAITIEGIELDGSQITYRSDEGIRIEEVDNTIIRACFIHSLRNQDGDGIFIWGTDDVPRKVTIQDVGLTNLQRGAITGQNFSFFEVTMSNCIATKVNHMLNSSIGAFGFYRGGYDQNGSVCRFVNCIGQNERALLSFSIGNSGGTIEGDNNASDDDTAPGANSYHTCIFQDNTNPGVNTVMLVDLTTVPADMHLIDDPGNIAIDNGRGPDDVTYGQYVNGTDIDGDARTGLICNLGFDEFSGAGPIIHEVDLTMNKSVSLAAGGQSVMALDMLAPMQMTLQDQAQMVADRQTALPAQYGKTVLANLIYELTTLMPVSSLFSLDYDTGLEVSLELGNIFTLSPSVLTDIQVACTLAKAFGLSHGVSIIHSAAIDLDLFPGLSIVTGGINEGSLGLSFTARIDALSGQELAASINAAFLLSLLSDEIISIEGDIGLDLATVMSAQVLAQFDASVDYHAVFSAFLGVQADLQADLVQGIELDQSYTAQMVTDAGLILDFTLTQGAQGQVIQSGQITTPDKRVFKINYENRTFSIEFENRTKPIH